MKNMFVEYQFSARDLDAGDQIVDVISLREHIDPELYINEYIRDRYELTTMNSNTWQLEGYQKTGKKYTVQTIRTVISERQEKFNQEYPIINY